MSDTLSHAEVIRKTLKWAITPGRPELRDSIIALDALLTEMEQVVANAAAAVAGLRGTTRSLETPDDVTVEFTDAGWQACMRLLQLGRTDG